MENQEKHVYKSDVEYKYVENTCLFGVDSSSWCSGVAEAIDHQYNPGQLMANQVFSVFRGDVLITRIGSNDTLHIVQIREMQQMTAGKNSSIEICFSSLWNQVLLDHAIVLEKGPDATWSGIHSVNSVKGGFKGPLDKLIVHESDKKLVISAKWAYNTFEWHILISAALINNSVSIGFNRQIVAA